MKKIPIEKVVLVLAAAFASYNFGLAGGYIEGSRFSAGGLTAGVVVNVSLAIAASRFGGIGGARRTRQALIAFVAMLLLSPLLVSPVIYYSLPGHFLGSWVLRVLWAVGWPLVADLAIVLAGAVTGKGLISLQESAPHSAGSAPQSVRTVRRSADAVRTQCAALSAQYACTEPQCGWSPSVDGLEQAAKDGRNPKTSAASAKAGHMKNKHKPIPLDQSLLITPKKETKK